MSRFVRMFHTSIGCKQIMAVTGVVLVLFVIGHLAGNLLIYAGQDALNQYAQNLQSMGPLLWLARLVLLAAFVLHIVAGVRLSKLNHQARDVRYQVNAFSQTDPLRKARVTAAMYMLQTGLVILAFVIYHLLHFTLGFIGREGYQLMQTLPDGTERHDVYGMVIFGFRQSAVALSYVVAMLFLGAHLVHGFGSMFQTFGAHNPVVVSLVKVITPIAVAFIVIGNCAIPLSILLGLYGGGGS